MEAKRKNRKILRGAFTRCANELEALLSAEIKEHEAVEVAWEMLQQRYESIRLVDEQIYSDLLEEDAGEEDMVEEISSCESYLKRYTTLRLRSRHIQEERHTVQTGSRDGTESVSQNEIQGKRSFTLPTIEFKKFSGDIKDWLGFWGQFKKVHDDPNIDIHDKISYLAQATVPGSRARRVVESFPAMEENYVKIIDCLQSRFGREDLQIEVYVRELLKLILNTAVAQNTIDISTLYDQIETQLRALETLGITKNNCAAILFPLIESCLPESILRVWQHSGGFSSGFRNDTEDSPLQNRLDSLMTFLKNEVDNEQRILLASDNFGLRNITSHSKLQGRYKSQSHTEQRTSSAASLVNCEKLACVFCGSKHNSLSCVKAQDLTLPQKLKSLTENRACFKCLQVGHLSRRCQAKIKCLVCRKLHATLMCPELPGHKLSEKEIETKVNKGEATGRDQALSNHTSFHVFLQTLQVELVNGNLKRVVRALLDSGSQRSYILRSTADGLACWTIGQEEITHCLFGGVETAQIHKRFEVTATKGKYSCTFEALDQPKICSDIAPVFDGPWLEELKKLSIEVSDTGNTQPIEVLLGADVLCRIMTGRQKVLQCGLVAVETKLGWCLMGEVITNRPNYTATMTTLSLHVQNATLNDLWDLEVLGIRESSEKISRQEMAQAAKDLFLDTVTTDVEGRFEVRLPWCVGHPPVPNNYDLSRKRLKATLQKLERDNLMGEYSGVFREWEESRIIEKVMGEDESHRQGHYLPHRPVVKESSATTKIRPVFDASAHEKNKPSLNNCLEKGVNLIEQIPSILLRFRKHAIGVVSDITKAFLQISVHPADRDFLKFLWVDIDGKETVYRHRRVVFGVNSSPFLLGSTIEHHLYNCLKRCALDETAYSKETVDKLLESFYVDNCLTSVSDITTLTTFVKEAADIMAEGKFELRGWAFTGDGLVKEVPVLGVVWHLKSDTLTVSLEGLKEKMADVVTKRLILSLAQRVFDPIGFTSPTTLIPKLLLQKLWEDGLGWDAPVLQDISHSFRRWVEELPSLEDMKIPRCIEMDSDATSPMLYSLHTFCDASQAAYGAVIFLRVIRTGQVSVHLLAAKARVAPLKKITIPRLELLAALIGARLYSGVKESLKNYIESYFWSDSSTVVHWIRGQEEWAPFVGNRGSEIRKLTPVDAWKHIPGALNPADLPSRGCSPRQLLESKWWEGPAWLYGEPDMWPKDISEVDEKEVYQEHKKKLVFALVDIGNSQWHFDYFSKYQKTVRMMAWVLRFVNNTRYPCVIRNGELDSKEMYEAERLMWKIVQQGSFSKEDKRLSTLRPFRDAEGIIRTKSQVSRRNDEPGFRFPIVLPAKHLLVEKLIYDTHVKSCHVGTNGLLNILRENYWILGGRRSIRAVLRKCMVCKRHTGKSIMVESPPLPLDRVRDAAAFEVTGVDLAGPLYLRSGSKVWICLFTCAVFRAVHLELISSLSTPCFIQALRRFVARRGRPKTILSDNGTNFTGTENAFGSLHWDQIHSYAAVERIQWKFNPPTAAWWGGFWERLVGVMKRLLRKVLGRASLNFEELTTILCDCEAVINNRPLTYMSDDPVDMIPLTPSMFLRDLAESGVPDCDEVDRTLFCRRMRFKQKLREDLRSRFRIEYLGQLKSYASRGPVSSSISIGDVVLIGDDNLKRIDWCLGRVIEIFPGKDGRVRVVRVQTSKGQLLRPVQRIYHMECSESRSTLERVNSNPLVEEAEEETDLSECANKCASGMKSAVSNGESVSVARKSTRSGRVLRLPRRYMY